MFTMQEIVEGVPADSETSQRLVPFSSHYFDKIAEDYDAYNINDYAYRTLSELPSLLAAIGNLQGKTVVEYGCSDGFFCLLWDKLGARSVLGLDLSPAMISNAKKGAEKKKSRAQFQVWDCLCQPAHEPCDVLTVPYTFNFAAQDYDSLVRMCCNAHSSLKRNGMLVALIDHWNPPPTDEMVQYGESLGVTKIANRPAMDGDEIMITLQRKGTTTFKAYLVTQEALEAALKTAGFRNVQFSRPVVLERAIDRLGAEIVSWCTNNPLSVVVTALAGEN